MGHRDRKSDSHRSRDCDRRIYSVHQLCSAADRRGAGYDNTADSYAGCSSAAGDDNMSIAPGDSSHSDYTHGGYNTVGGDDGYYSVVDGDYCAAAYDYCYDGAGDVGYCDLRGFRDCHVGGDPDVHAPHAVYRPERGVRGLLDHLLADRREGVDYCRPGDLSEFHRAALHRERRNLGQTGVLGHRAEQRQWELQRRP